jgi:hypothetical protein
MQWQQPAPVSRKYRYAVLTVILVVIAFLVVVAVFTIALDGMSATATSQP